MRNLLWWRASAKKLRRTDTSVRKWEPEQGPTCSFISTAESAHLSVSGDTKFRPCIHPGSRIKANGNIHTCIFAHPSDTSAPWKLYDALNVNEAEDKGLGAARVGPKTVRKESHRPRWGTPDSKRVKEEGTSTRVVPISSSTGAWGGTQGQDVGRLQPKSN